MKLFLFRTFLKGTNPLSEILLEKMFVFVMVCWVWKGVSEPVVCGFLSSITWVIAVGALFPLNNQAGAE